MQTLVPVVQLTPVAGSLFESETAEECWEVTKSSLSDFFDMNRPAFARGERLWADWGEGIIGFETDKEYYFARFVVSVKTSARSSTFSSSRTLPGHPYCMSRSMPTEGNPLPLAPLVLWSK